MTESSTANRESVVAVDPAVSAFIFREARLADEALYSDWEGLWDDVATYRVPMHPDDDPERTIAYINDNRARIKSRVAQLNTGTRYSQTPPSMLRRIIGNIEVLNHDGDIVTIGANFVLFEYRHALSTWAGRYVYRIRVKGRELRLVEKTVHLVNAGGPVPTMSFLI